jgi:undecaprenyl-diphosphatase
MAVSKRSIKEKVKGISIRFIIIALVFIISVVLFHIIADEMVLENENQLDRLVFNDFSAITNPRMTQVMLVITFFGSSTFLLPAYLLLIIAFLFSKRKRLSLDIAAYGIISTIILFSLKSIFHRHRPPDPLVHFVNGFSFPSGHAFSSFVFFGLLIYIIWRTTMKKASKWAFSILFFFFATAIAISRVYLHVHYASDVVAGFCLCMAWLCISLWLIRKVHKKEREKAVVTYSTI